MLLMMLPGSTTTCHIISLFITAIASVLAYYGYLTALVQAAAVANLSHTIYHCFYQQALNDAISVLPGPPWLLSWLAQITKQQRTTVRQVGKMNEWHMALHQLLRDISILIHASNPAPIITSLSAFSWDTDHLVADLYSVNGQLTTLAENLQGLESAINGGYDCFQVIWLQELRALITRVEQNVVKCMLLAKEWLPAPGDLTIIWNLPSNLSLITSHTEWMASKDLAYNILHCINSLANNLISPTIPCPASAPAPGLTVLTLPPQVEFASSHARDKPHDVSHLESYDALLEPLVHPAGINRDVNP